MIISVSRQVVTAKSTIGQLTVGTMQCFTLEDPIRKIKVWGNTCIPAGQYGIRLRTDGGVNAKYVQRFGDFHHGMLWLQDVPHFEFVYLHIGNTPADTEGCILVGAGAGTDEISRSEDAYRQIYPVIAGAILGGDEVLIEVSDPG